MEDDVLREAMSRRDSALAEARRLDDFIRMYNDLRGGRGAAPAAAEPAPAPAAAKGAAPAGGDALGGEFILDKGRR